MAARKLRLGQSPEIQRIILYVELPYPKDSLPSTYTSIDWDSPCKQTKLNGKPFALRPNLYALLTELAQTWPSEGQKHIWCDFVCIDQSAVEERNSQVNIMESIYRRAQSTLIWLGPAHGLIFAMTDFLVSYRFHLEPSTDAEHLKSVNDQLRHFSASNYSSDKLTSNSYHIIWLIRTGPYGGVVPQRVAKKYIVCMGVTVLMS